MQGVLCSDAPRWSGALYTASDARAEPSRAAPAVARAASRRGAQVYSATGVMNTGGNAAGLLAPIIGILLDQFGWLSTLASGSIFALIGAGLWMLIRVPERRAA